MLDSELELNSETAMGHKDKTDHMANRFTA